ncbi:thymidine kinase [[Mycoplasma] gypis]|uniref:Thymidine kinase n=1 Tax=[Mycoplasma] gypis TaxID=92404 RepID=A0ABZ2RPH0_9BACT|nr:thymidine kinase [[Mycoplasma] gypis]MBN0919560.1 thymidine kinase [[Mycoplasma] gypis]
MALFKKGEIHVIVGPMFSGKSEELLRRVRRLEIAGYNLLLVKSVIDTRFGIDKISSRSGANRKTNTVKNANEIKTLITPNIDAVIIDETQFLGDEVVDVCEWLANKGLMVIISGLDQDFRRKPFDNMARLMALAENVTKLQAICVKCKNDASCSFRTVNSDDTVLIDNNNIYEARCRICHIAGEEAKKAK